MHESTKKYLAGQVLMLRSQAVSALELAEVTQGAADTYKADAVRKEERAEDFQKILGMAEVTQ